MDEDQRIAAIEKITPSVINIGTIRMLRRSLLEVVPLKGVGSGFVIDSGGLILTNAHVIEQTQEIEVALPSGEKLRGTVRGKDSSSDIAVISVDESGLPAVELGDSDKLRVGQEVVAIGNPLGLTGGPTVTAGVISSLNRNIESEEAVLQHLIQTDASINPGNSGGPLINSEGKVIGINTAIIPYAQGIGFAIPINRAKTIADDLIQYEEYRKPSLGIVGVSVDETLARRYDLPLSHGVLVAKIIRGSTAHRSGIQPGDIIVGVEGSTLSNLEELQSKLSERRPGDELKITTVSRGREEQVKLTLDTRNS